MKFSQLTNLKAPFLFSFLYLFSGLSLKADDVKSTQKDKAPYKELEIFARVMHFIEENYVDSVDSKELIIGAVRGMLHTLDPHSAYMAPKLYKEFKDDTSGQFGGLGIEVGYHEKQLTVIAPIEDSPAFKAGVQARDKIIKIDNKVTRDLSVPDAIALLKGKPGMKVTLTLRRANTPKDIVVSVERAIIRVSTVKSTLFHEDTGYIRVTSFGDQTASDSEKAIEKYQANKNVKGLVLDLRGNPGGLLDQAIKLSNLFIDEGPIVYTIGRDKSKKEVESAQRGRRITKLPLVVLVDGIDEHRGRGRRIALHHHPRTIVDGRAQGGQGFLVLPLTVVA